MDALMRPTRRTWCTQRTHVPSGGTQGMWRMQHTHKVHACMHLEHLRMRVCTRAQMMHMRITHARVYTAPCHARERQDEDDALLQRVWRQRVSAALRYCVGIGGAHGAADTLFFGTADLRWAVLAWDGGTSHGMGHRG